MELFWIFAGITLAGFVAYGFQIWAIRKKLNEQERREQGAVEEDSRALPSSPKALPGISILKPLKGIDDNLFDNLASLCRQDYPRYEIIFALQDYNDPACKVARKIREKHPEQDITILVEQCSTGLNPKVNNLVPALKASKYEMILISDSNVMVGRDYLKETAGHMLDPDTGLVSNLIQGTGGRSLGSVFENLHLNSFIMGSVCFLDRFLKMPCVIGKSMLMRKKDLEAIGGFPAVKDVLAEDYLIGKKMENAGKKVILSHYMIRNVNQYWGIRKFLNRHIRWGKLRWRIGGFRYVSELIGNPVFMSSIPMFLWEPSKITASLFLASSCIKIMGDLYIGKIIRAPMRSFLYFLSPVKDMIIGIIWFIPLLSNTVIWRGNKYLIGKDSCLSPCTETGIWSWRYRLTDAIRARFA
ncbi:MAG: ceramide glucosyltransferase [Nitrospirota bacterium]